MKGFQLRLDGGQMCFSECMDFRRGFGTELDTVGNAFMGGVYHFQQGYIDV